MRMSAVISRKYRYVLHRGWDVKKPTLVWVMLNPSTATAKVDDATIRRCVAFGRALGYGAVTIVNLFAYRSTNPRRLSKARDAVGPSNALYIIAASAARDVIVAWGKPSPFVRRSGQIERVYDLLKERAKSIKCLATNADGSPKHPLYVAGSTKPKKWEP